MTSSLADQGQGKTERWETDDVLRRDSRQWEGGRGSSSAGCTKSITESEGSEGQTRVFRKAHIHAYPPLQAGRKNREKSADLYLLTQEKNSTNSSPITSNYN